MGFLQLPKVCILLLAACLSTEALVTLPNVGSPERVLRAATKRSDVFRRSMRIQSKFDTEVSYIEKENGWNGNSIFASQVKLGSEAPILHLEEIEHHLYDVHCGSGKMKLHFVDIVSARDAKASCFGENGGRIITSHEGCNNDGERAVYKVNDVTVSNDEHSLELSIVQSTWKDAFAKFEIEFGYTNDDHIYRRHSDFQKVRKRRQAAGSTASVTAVIPIPSGTPEDVTSQTLNISSQLIDTTFELPDFVNTLSALVPLPSVPIDLKCKNCTTTGTLVLTQGAINIDTANIADLDPNSDVITGGFFELAANDMSAHIELVAKPVSSNTFSVTLPVLPILGFVIPGIGKAGVTFNQTLTASYEVTESIEVSYGFDVVVPNPSTIRVELTDFAKSGVVGFPNSKLTPLPFSANISGINILLSATYLPSIPIAFQFLDQLEVGVSVSMDLPRLDLRLSNNDAKCNALESATTKNSTDTTTAPGLLAALGSLVLVEANVSISLDVGAKFEFPLLPVGLNNIATAANIFETTIELLTSCLDPARAFALATQIPASNTVNYIASTSSVAVASSTPCATSKVKIPSSTACATSTVTVTLPYIPPSAASVTAPPFVSSTVVVDGLVPVSSIVQSGGHVPSVSGTVDYTAPSPTASLFTGAATPGAPVSTLNWKVFEWQAAVLGVSLVAGVMVLL